MKPILALLACFLAASVGAATPVGDPTAVTKIPGLVAFWIFSEDAGQPRVSTGTRDKHPLQEVDGVGTADGDVRTVSSGGAMRNDRHRN